MIKFVTVWVLTVVFYNGTSGGRTATSWQFQYQTQQTCINAAKKYVRASQNSMLVTYYTFCDQHQIPMVVPEQGVKTK